MPSLRDNKNKWGLPTNTAPVGVRCISVPVPDDPEWIAKFYGAIYQLSQQIYWDRDEAHTAKIVAARWQEVYIAALMSECMGEQCDECLERIERDPATGFYGFRPTGSIDFYRFPDGAWVDNAPITYWPEPPTRTGTEDDMRCIAARNATLVIRQFYNETVAITAADAATFAWQLVFEVIQHYILLLTNGGINLRLAFELAQEMITAGIDDAFVWGDDQSDELQCFLYCNSTVEDGIVSFDAEAVGDLMIASWFTGGFAFAKIIVVGFLGADGLKTAGGIHN